MRPALSIKTRIFGAYVIVLALGAMLAALVYFAGAQVQRTSHQLVNEDLPRLQTLAQFKLDIAAQESALLQYFVNRERPRFLRDYARIESICTAELDQLALAFRDDARLDALRSEYARLNALGRALDDTLNAPRVDEARARQTIAQASTAARNIKDRLDAVSVTVESQAREAGAYAHMTAQRMQVWVTLLAGAIFLVSLAVGYYINAYINEQAERRRLAMFPERNPNPVLQLSSDGAIRYVNPAATTLAQVIGATDVRALLPEDLSRRLAELKHRAEASELWEYVIAGTHAIECGIHWFDDLDVFHAYVVDVTERKRAQERVVHQTYHDALTGLPNRRKFEERLGYTLSVTARGGMRAALLLLGLDRTHALIAGFGHTAGDTLLRAFGARLQTLLSENHGVEGSTLYRFDGDRFVVLLAGFADSQAPQQLAEHILAALAQPFDLDGREHHASVSIGISVSPDDGHDASALLRNAESALAVAKQSGGSGYRRYAQEMNAHATENLVLENELRHALERNELRLFYQPQIDIGSGAVIGVEALIRWQHPRLDLVSPGMFMPLAEESGLIVPLGEWVLRTACAQCVAWRARGDDALVVAVNISAKQFAQPGLATIVQEVLRETGLASSGLELEITESVAMYDVARTASLLWELRRIGVKLSVDDFGTGFSSLSYLRRFPLDKLKVDQSFVRNLTTNDSDAAIARAVIDLGHSLRLRVIAEGVETPEQLARLREFGCDEYQGYLFSKPIPPERLTALLSKHPRAHPTSASDLGYMV